ncbi:OmpH family outer membrane protein [Crocinitomix catalasitica]|uniref:OmpH family outer membrane protein n=1 Tax=Crocinitomix catalasitica TaxID=184607 RepID=UPI000480C5A4|nr:OmpH family outer membrane protein [Crocinitomix catalasitica]
MKKLIVGIVAMLTLGATNVSAQNAKIAHIDYLVVTDSLPSKLKADKEIAAYIQEEQTVLQEAEAKLRKDVEIHMADAENLSPTIRQMREEKLSQRQNDLQLKSQQLQQDVQTLSARYYNPIEARLTKAVETVAKKNNVTYVLDQGQTLYAAGLDLTKEVTAEMLKSEPVK